MRYVVIAPWKLDTRGPLAAAVKLYEERIGAKRGDTFELILPSSQPEGEKEATQFLIKECRKKREENALLVFLDESGQACDSEAFAGKLEKAASQGFRSVVFCLGGAYGLPRELADDGPTELVSLSLLTLAHELALAVLLEQIYRAQCIHARHPYHHALKSPLAKAAATLARGGR